MSFSSLPTELVRQIIESSIPSTFHSTTYRERQSTLRSLCLISRRFRQLAQPLLFQIIRIKSPETLASASEALRQERGGNLLRHLLVTCRQGCIYFPELFDELIKRCDGICDLVLQVEGAHKIELAPLQSLPNLANLQLSGGGHQLSSPFVLSKLHTLQLDVEVLYTVSSSLDPGHLPSLRNLALVNVYEIEDALELQTHRFFHLLPQLRSFYSDWELVQSAPELWRDYLDRILSHSYGFDLRNFVTLRLPVQHLRIYELFDGDRHYRNLPEVEEFIAWIKLGKGVNLRSLYLDAGLQDSSRLLAKDVDLLRSLRVVCEVRKIDIVFEKQPRDAHIDSFISEEFAKRQETLMRVES